MILVYTVKCVMEKDICLTQKGGGGEVGVLTIFLVGESRAR